MEDLIKPHFPAMTEARATLLSKALAMSYGLLCLAMAYLTHLMGDSVLQVALKIFGMVGGPILGVFCLGMFFPWANSTGALAGLGAGLAVAFWVGIGSIITRSSGARLLPPDCRAILLSDNTTAVVQTALSNVTLSSPSGLKRFYSLSYMWYSAFNCLTVIIVGLIISFLTGPMKEVDLTPGTLYPLLGKLLFFLPERLKKKLCCVTPQGQTATGTDNSTQMYYVKLTIDHNAVAKVNKLLRPFVHDNNLTVDGLKFTTSCETDKNNKTECTCKPDYKWSDCQSDQDDCTDTQIFSKEPIPSCISSSTVTINGSLNLNETYGTCLHTDGDDCRKGLLKKVKTVYSTLSGFEKLTIDNYRVGMLVTADLNMTIATNFNAQDLVDRSKELAKILNASFVLETQGSVKITAPSRTVRYSSKQYMSCSVTKSLGVEAEWILETDTVDKITDGTVSVVTSTMKNSTLKLRNVTEHWAGLYTCTYEQKLDNITILHKASTTLDVSLLPDIYISASPSFPRCHKSAAVKVKCEIQKSNENYTVEWEPENIMSGIKKTDSPSGNHVIYEAETLFGCDEVPSITCIFKNRLKQPKSATFTVHTIKGNDKYCEADREWENTLADFTAMVRCKNEVGFKKRHCYSNGTWGSVKSACVNLEVNSVLQSAIAADSGLGLLDQNAANVFQRLEKVTNNTKTINTFSNMDASVEVLTSLSTKLQANNEIIINDTTVNNVLQSSSNLLEKSLESTWNVTDETENVTLAERYLSSVEQLIEVTNTTNDYSKSNLELKVNNCNGTICHNNVFGVNVSLSKINPDSVKTAGFKQLNEYLPDLDDYLTNSIVVSTSTGTKQKDNLEIKLTFPLLTPRTRNFEMKCVAWNNNTGQWSTDGCKWGGPWNEGECTCIHLSSFAILMSKEPLKTVGLTELTYFGLSVSIVSLILSLAIELAVWNSLVKSDALYLRHTAHINISLCLLIADCCFVASSKPEDISQIWCRTSVVLKHFCYLAMFFWMLCLSTTILHQTVFPFHIVSKKNYLRFALILGYVCPFLIVAITFLTNDAGAKGKYYSEETCWLIYDSLLSGSIHTFIIPVGIIVFVNIFCMAVVIMKLLEHPKNIVKCNGNEKAAVKTVMRSVILLTPIFGGTWILGFGVTILDLSYGPLADVVNYAFTLMNSLQGLFILVTTCLGEKRTREALMKRLRKDVVASITDSSTKLDSPWKK
ncbi:adhesion G protein-coupled receptor F4 [Scomber scombrus]|uniref:Adhesion G protein-coupled receptor F4 n=1 Tax=Scomber scombrus TaxID=13677 RepID=A0AAV1P3X7_SCOSC